jgi:hypothetical protein
MSHVPIGDQCDSETLPFVIQTGKHDAMRSAAFLFFVAAIVGLALSPPPARACTCSAPATPGEGLRRSATVFKGRVIEISRPFLDRIGLTKSAGYRVKFEVVRQWKGASSRTLEVITRLTGEACGFPFEENKEYVVYVVNEPADIQTGICTGTKSAADAEQEMKQLDDLVGAIKQ